ncbi:MAG: prolipoprotein diacylglyceryl transferase [Bacteroidales bacterium]|nr:prolipoprotein diacylglyceryl transferase [Bacteroidales bacterium]
MKFILLSYPTISDAINDFIGTNLSLPIQTYGFFVAVAFIVGAFIMTSEYKRKESEGLMCALYKIDKIGEKATPLELISSFLLTFLVCFKVVEIIFNYNEFSENAQEFLLSTRGSWVGGIICGLITAGYTWYDRNKKKLDKPKTVIIKQMPHQLTGNILVVTGLFGIIGAKIFHNLENFDRFLADPIGELFSFSGLTFFGGLIVGGTAGAIYLKKLKINSFHTLDAAAFGLPMSYALGRLGCQISGDGCWGIVNNNPCPSWIPEWAWSSNFPHNVINNGIHIPDCTGQHCRMLAESVYPTSLYESLMMLIIFGIIFCIRKKIKFPGMLLGIYLSLQGIERLLIEQIRVNNKFNILGMEVTQAQMIATGLLISGAVIIFLTYKFRDKISELCKPIEQIPQIPNAEIIEKKD